MGNIRSLEITKDKGYAWIIVLTSFLSHFANVGFSFGIAGNLTIIYQEFFKVDLQQGSLVGSVHIGVLFLFGPLTAAIVKKFGCQVAELFGGVLILVGVGLCAFSTALWHAVVSYGVIAGIGVSFSYTASSQILAVYFDKLKYLAFSLAIFGYYIGLMTWPIFSQFLFDKFGYSKAMGIMTSFHVLHIIAGISFFEPKEEQLKNVKTIQNSKGESDEGVSDMNSIIMKDSQQDLANDDYLELFGQQETSAEDCDESSRSIKADFATLLKSWKIWLSLINALFWTANASGYLILVNSYILDSTDLNESEVDFGETVIGVSNIIGCVSVVLTSSLKFDRFFLYSCSTAVFGVAAIVTTFATTKETYYTFAACWGLGQSVTVTCLLGITSDLCTVSQFSLLFGLELLAEGIGEIALVPLAAYIGETTSEKYGIMFVGCCGVLGAVAVLPIVVFNALDKRKGYSNLL